MAWLKFLCFGLSLQFVLVVVLCSSGDRSSDFISCCTRCEALTCRNAADGDKKLTIALKITGWTCLADCQYQCMHEVTALDINLNRPVRQFFGKVSSLALLQFIFEVANTHTYLVAICTGAWYARTCFCNFFST